MLGPNMTAVIRGFKICTETCEKVFFARGLLQGADPSTSPPVYEYEDN